jgi:DNA-binding transcriptional regulator YhcF (GntR family)
MQIAEELRRAKSLLSVRQVAEALAAHPQTIYGWVATSLERHFRRTSRCCVMS